MPFGIYVSAEGANVQATRLETIANNMANVETVGFKKNLAVFQARYAEAIQEGLMPPGTGAIEDEGGGVMTRQTVTDFSSGPLKRTGRSLDMAIRGDGFFAVEKEGQTYLTRAGNFMLNSRGDLMTQQGYPVLNSTGGPISILSENGPWELTSDGVIRQPQGGVEQTLGLMTPESLGDLVKVGENLFRPLAEPRALEPAKRGVTNEYLEMSGVQPTTEMVDMITASRIFEANTKMMQTHDQMLSGLVNRLLRVR
ncbi:MAG: flagellar hook-basal body protein [Pirellulales bacterium]|nr:flagellar hook-basal body protein [Pirellulales bacterium]